MGGLEKNTQVREKAFVTSNHGGLLGEVKIQKVS